MRDLGDEEDESECDEDDDLEEDDDDLADPCPRCGRPLYHDAEWCPHCERYLSQEDTPRRKPGWLVLGVVVGIILTLSCGLIWPSLRVWLSR